VVRRDPIYSTWFLRRHGAAAQQRAGALPQTLRRNLVHEDRYLGVGAMLIGGVWTLFSMRGHRAGIRSGSRVTRQRGAQ